jgi:hypothetical protein
MKDVSTEVLTLRVHLINRAGEAIAKPVYLPIALPRQRDAISFNDCVRVVRLVKQRFRDVRWHTGLVFNESDDCYTVTIYGEEKSSPE